MPFLWSLLAVAHASEIPVDPPPFTERIERQRKAAAGIVRVEGALILAVDVLHFAAIPLLNGTLRSQLDAEDYGYVQPPFILNHAVSGVLLLPVGLGNLYAAGGLRRGERWGWVVATMNATALMALPAVMALTMGPEYFRAAPFAMAAGTVTAVGATQWIPLIAWHGAFGER